MVRRGTGLHADQAWRQSLEERRNLAAAKLLSDDDLLGPVNAVNLEHVLGDIQTDRGNLHVDGSPDVIRLRRTTLWHFDAGNGRRPPHQNRTFVAGFLTSNARHAERSNDRCPVLPHRPRLSRSMASAGSPTMIA